MPQSIFSALTVHKVPIPHESVLFWRETFKATYPRVTQPDLLLKDVKILKRIFTSIGKQEYEKTVVFLYKNYDHLVEVYGFRGPVPGVGMFSAFLQTILAEMVVNETDKDRDNLSW